MNKAFIETAKELFRIVFFAAIAALVAWGFTKIASLNPDSIYAIVGTIILRLVDKWVHENEQIQMNGISPV